VEIDVWGRLPTCGGFGNPIGNRLAIRLPGVGVKPNSQQGRLSRVRRIGNRDWQSPGRTRLATPQGQAGWLRIAQTDYQSAAA